MLQDLKLHKDPNAAPHSIAAAEPATLLKAEGLSVSYDRYEMEPLEALKGISFEVREGEMIGLVGESGAGKSLLARTIMSSIPGGGYISSGSMTFRGRNLYELADKDRLDVLGNQLSMVVSNPRSELNPVLTIGEQIANVVRYHKHVSRRQALDEALQMLRAVRIPDPERRLGAYPHEMSGGMAQRVVIAIALACSPQMVISDDATSALDVTVQMQILELMAEMVASKNAAALFITRDIAITAHFCQRVVILYAGEIVEEAVTADFFDRPMHPYSVMLFAAFSHSEAMRKRWTAVPQADLGACACPFAPRCVRRQPRCIAEKPELRQISSGRKVRCHYPVEG